MDPDPRIFAVVLQFTGPRMWYTQANAEKEDRHDEPRSFRLAAHWADPVTVIIVRPCLNWCPSIVVSHQHTCDLQLSAFGSQELVATPDSDADENPHGDANADGYQHTYPDTYLNAHANSDTDPDIHAHSHR